MKVSFPSFISRNNDIFLHTNWRDMLHVIVCELDNFTKTASHSFEFLFRGRFQQTKVNIQMMPG